MNLVFSSIAYSVSVFVFWKEQQKSDDMWELEIPREPRGLRFFLMLLLLRYNRRR
jgi:hypothetical protein